MTVGPREKKLALILGAIVALVVVIRLGRGDGAGIVPAVPSLAGRPREGGDAPQRQVVDLDLSALTPREKTYDLERDPFRYGAVPTPIPTPTPPPPPPPPEPTPTPWQPPPPPAPPPPPPADHLRFLGTFGPAESRIAVIVSGEEIYNVRRGAVLEGKFIVQDIGYESVAIGFVGFPDAPPRRLPAGG